MRTVRRLTGLSNLEVSAEFEFLLGHTTTENLCDLLYHQALCCLRDSHAVYQANSLVLLLLPALPC